jgi:hypothetical protein
LRNLDSEIVFTLLENENIEYGLNAWMNMNMQVIHFIFCMVLYVFKNCRTA